MERTTSYCFTLPAEGHAAHDALVKLRAEVRLANKFLAKDKIELRLAVTKRARAGKNNPASKLMRQRRWAGPQMVPIRFAQRVDVYVNLVRYKADDCPEWFGACARAYGLRDYVCHVHRSLPISG